MHNGRFWKTGKKQEGGYVEVEAAIILPLGILSVLMLLYLSLFLFQRANLQACLETALVYYKNTVTDTYVSKNEEVEYLLEEGSYMGAGNSYSVSGPLSPYRGIFGDGNDLNSQEAFESYFYSIAGDMLFDEDLELTIDYSNYVVFKQFEVTAVQKVGAPVDFSALGIGNEYTISATARVAVVDHDGIIRDADYAIDLLSRTKLGDMVKAFAETVSQAYDKMKEILDA